MSAVGAVYDRTFFVDSTKHARSQTAPTVRQLQLFEIESHFQLHPPKTARLTAISITIASSDRSKKGAGHEISMAVASCGIRRRGPFRECVGAGDGLQQDRIHGKEDC